MTKTVDWYKVIYIYYFGSSFIKIELLILLFVFLSSTTLAIPAARRGLNHFSKQGLVTVKSPPYLLDVKLRGVEISFSSNLSLVITHDYPWLPMITHDYPWLPMDFFYGHIGTVTRFYVEKLLSLSPVPWQLVSPK